MQPDRALAQELARAHVVVDGSLRGRRVDQSALGQVLLDARAVVLVCRDVLAAARDDLHEAAHRRRGLQRRILGRPLLRAVEDVQRLPAERDDEQRRAVRLEAKVTARAVDVARLRDEVVVGDHRVERRRLEEHGGAARHEARTELACRAVRVGRLCLANHFAGDVVVVHHERRSMRDVRVVGALFPEAVQQASLGPRRGRDQDLTARQQDRRARPEKLLVVDLEAAIAEERALVERKVQEPPTARCGAARRRYAHLKGHRFAVRTAQRELLGLLAREHRTQLRLALHRAERVAEHFVAHVAARRDDHRDRADARR